MDLSIMAGTMNRLVAIETSAGNSLTALSLVHLCRFEVRSDAVRSNAAFCGILRHFALRPFVSQYRNGLSKCGEF